MTKKKKQLKVSQKNLKYILLVKLLLWNSNEADNKAYQEKHLLLTLKQLTFYYNRCLFRTHIKWKMKINVKYTNYQFKLNKTPGELTPK